jgi:hypothetical protein
MYPTAHFKHIYCHRMSLSTVHTFLRMEATRANANIKYTAVSPVTMNEGEWVSELRGEWRTCLEFILLDGEIERARVREMVRANEQVRKRH